MLKKFKVGIIGCSSISEKAVIPAILNSKKAQLHMIGSRSSSKAKNFANKFLCKNYGNYEDVLENSELDAVYISLPISMHEEWIKKSAKAGKHILCEKSAVLSFRSAKNILEECKKNNVKLSEAFSYKFHLQHKKIKYLIKNKKIKPINYFIAKYGFPLNYEPKNFRFIKKLGGGVLNDVGCYVINSSSLFFSNEPISIYCHLTNSKKYDIDIDGVIEINYLNNQKTLGIFSYTSYFQSDYTIWGKNGYITALRAYNIKNNMKAKIEYEIDDKRKSLLIKSSNQYQIMIDSFIEEIKSKKRNSENEFLMQAKIMEAARLSNKRNRPIFLDKIK